MKLSSLASIIALVAGSAVGRAQTPPPAAADVRGDDPVELPRFQVSAEKADPYRALEAVSLARISGAVLDTPVTINVMSRELLDDLGANSTFEAARYFPGIGNGRGAGTNGGINDRMNFRGFESQTRTVNSFSGTFIPGTSTSIDTIEPEYMERVEIVMGPNAILNPTGTPGGSMNVVTKTPKFNPQATVRLMLGNYSANKFSFDVTGPVQLLGGGRKLAYRLIGTAQDTDTYIPGGFEKWTGGAMLEYQLSPTARINFTYIGVDFKAFENASAPNDNGWLIYEPTSIRGAVLPDTPQTPGVTYNGRNGVNANSITTERTNTVQLLYTGTLFDFVSMRLGGQFLTHKNVGDSAFPNTATSSSTFDPLTGQVTAAPAFNPAAVPVVWRYNYGVSAMHSFQNDYAANFTPTENTTLQFVTGWAFNKNHNFPSRTGTAPMPSVNLFTGEGHFAPRPDLKTQFSFSNRNESHATQKNAYALFKAGAFQDRAFLTGGATRTWVKSETYTRHPITSVLVNNPKLGGFRDSYIGSVLVKPLANVSAYYTYSTNANLVTFNSGNGIAQPLWSEGVQHEYGLKAELLEKRLLAAVTRFDMEQTNVTSPNPLANTNPQLAGNILTDNTSEGWEFSIVGGLTKNVSVIASYTDLKYRDAFGRRSRNVPDSMANGLIRYSFTEGRFKNLGLFAAVSYFGEAPAETITALAPAPSPGAPRVPGQPGFYTAAWHVINLGGSYSYGSWSFNLNIDNATDRKFGWQPASRLTVSPYPELTWRLTTGYTF